MDVMAIKYLRDTSLALGTAAMLTVSLPWGDDPLKDRDPIKDVASITISTSATGLHISMYDTILGQEIIGRKSEAGPRIEFVPTDTSSGSNV